MYTLVLVFDPCATAWEVIPKEKVPWRGCEHAKLGNGP